MPKHKIKKSIAVLLTATLTGTMMPCGAANLVPFNAAKPVVPQPVPVTKTLTESKPSVDGFSVQSVKSKINDIIKPQKSETKLQETYSGQCGTNVFWSLDSSTGELTISGSGSMDNYDEDHTGLNQPPWEKISVKSVTIQSGVTSTGNYAFANCRSLTSVTLQSGVTTIAIGTFRDCDQLTAVTLPDSITSIGQSAFRACTSLWSVTIPNFVTSIGVGAFAQSSLTSITIPDSVTSIGATAFNGCNFLSSVKFLGTLAPQFGNYVFPNGFVNSVTVPTIYASADFGGKTITKSIPSGYCGSTQGGANGQNVKWVLDNSDNSNPKLIISGTGEWTNDFQEILSAGTSAEQLSFNKSDIKTIILRNGVTIGDTSFDGFSSLEEIKVDANNGDYQTIDGVLFNKAGTSLIKWPDAKTSFKLSNNDDVSIMSVLLNAGSSPISQIQEVTIGKDVTNIESSPFNGFSALTAINVDVDNANFQSIDGVLFNKAGTSLIKWPAAKTSVTIPSTVTSIEAGAFAGCSALQFNEDGNAQYLGNSTNQYYALIKAKNTDINSLQINKDTEVIASDAFTGCNTLTAITVADGNANFKSIDGVLFNKAGTSLIKCPAAKTSVTIPSTVTSIEAGAFGSCSTLTSVRFNGTQDLNLDIFTGCTSLQKINVPGEYEGDKFCGIDVIKDYYKITYSLDGGTLADGSPDKYYVTADTTLVAPSRTGYTFTGWTGTGISGTQMTVTIENGSTGAKSFTANWTPINYDITYNLNDGVLAEGDTNPAQYTIESDAITLKNPTKEGYIFTGWTGSNGDTPQTEVTIPKGSTENKNYVANWKLAGGVIAGIVVGSVAAAAAATVGTILCLKNRQAVPAESTVPEENIVAV